MRIFDSFTKAKAWSIIFIIVLNVIAINSNAQLKISDFTIFGGTGVQIGSSNTINGGSLGSYTLVESTGNAAINSMLPESSLKLAILITNLLITPVLSSQPLYVCPY